MKKIIALFISTLLILPFNTLATVVNDMHGESSKVVEEKIYCTATINDDFEEYSILVTFKSSASVVNSEYTCTQLTEMFGLSIVSVRDLTRVSNLDLLANLNNFHQILSIKISTPGKQAVLDAIKIIEQHEDILCAEPNFIITLDPVTDVSDDISIMQEVNNKNNYELDTTSPNETVYQYAVGAMNLPKVWDITTGSSAVRVGVLDTGIDADHPDLQANLDTSLGADFTVETNGNPWVDTVGHGTHVAGIIGAVGNNGIGITGVCWNIKMVSLKVFERVVESNGTITGTGNIQSIIDAINYCINNNINIINYSGGGTTSSSNLLSKIADYDGLFICAAGNEKKNTDAPEQQHYPSGYTCQNIISVASIGNGNYFASSYSNYGAISIDLGAYGDNIISTYPLDLCGQNCQKTGHYQVGYHSMSGTSMAAPQVTGVVALLKSCAPDLTTAQIKQYILEETIYTTSLAGKVLTDGRLNPYDTIINALVKGVPSNRNTTLLEGNFRFSNTENSGCFLKTGSSSTAFISWDATDSTSNIESLAKVHWTSSSFNYANIQDRVVSGDFNGDGKDDVAALYYYGNNSTSLFMWYGSSSGLTSGGSKWSSSSFDADCIKGKVVAGDFNGDGKDDIAAFYDYGNSETGLFLWRGTSSGVTSMGKIWSSASYVASNITGKVTAGDYNGDGKDDIAAFYYYGNNQTTMYMWRGTSSGFTLLGQSSRWTSTSFDATKINYRVVSSDFSGDGKDDITAFYEVSTSLTRIFVWYGNTTSASSAGSSGVGEFSGYNSSNMCRKVVPVNIDDDIFEDIWFLYNADFHWLWSSAGEFYLMDYSY